MHFADVVHTKQFPTLPKLESINVAQSDVEGHDDDHIPGDILSSLLVHYAGQLRRLCATMPQVQDLSPEPFTKLTELELIGSTICTDCSGFLLNLNCPLAKLRLDLSHKGKYYYENWHSCPLKAIFKFDLHFWLERFPQLQSLQLLNSNRYKLETEFPSKKKTIQICVFYA